MESASLTAIIDFLPDATFAINRDGHVIAWNRAMEVMTGVCREDMIGKGDYAYSIPFYGRKRPILIDLVIHEEKPPESSYDYIKKQDNTVYAEAYAPGLNDGKGAYLWGTAAPLLDDNDDYWGAIESVRDITEHILIENKFRESEEKLRVIFDQTFQFMGLLSIDGIVIAANKQALGLIGVEEADAIGKPFWETTWWDHSEETQNQIKDAVKRAAAGESVMFETTHIDKKNKPLSIEFSLRPIKDKDGNIIYLNPEGRDISRIKETEKALRESEEKYHAIFDSVNDAIVIYDPQTEAFVDVNLRMCELFGYTRTEAFKISAADLSIDEIPYTVQDLHNWFRKAITGESQLFEWRTKAKDGRLFWVEINVRHAVINTHKCLLMTIRDITERKQAEKTLQWKTALLEAQTNTSIDGILVIDENNKRIIANQRIINLWSVPQHILDDEDDAALLQYVAGLVKYPEQFIEKVMYLYGHPYETSRDEIEFKSGMVLDRYSAPVMGENGHHYGRIWTFRDITSRKVSEEALKKSEEQFRTFFNLPIVGFAITAADNKWIHFNNTLCEMLGYSRNELAQKTWMDITPVEDLEKEMVLFKEVLTGGRQGSDFEKRYIHRNGSLIDVHISTQVVRNADNSIAYFASIIQDITERKLAEKLLEEQLQRFLVVTDQAPFGIALINREGTYTYINAKFKEIFGYDLRDIPDGRTWFRKAYPDPGYRHKVIKVWLSDMDIMEENIFMTVEGKWIFTVTCKDTAKKIISFIMLRLPTGEYLMTCEDVTERRKTEEALEKREAELEIKSTNLEEMNAALKVLLKERESDKIELEEKILSNVKELVLPYIEKLKRSRLDSQYMTYVDIVETNLNDIVSPFLQKMGLKYANLTPTEIEIANLIKNGKRTKAIGDLLHMSPGAINFHRNNIRKKLGLNNEKVNLRSYLMSLQ